MKILFLTDNFPPEVNAPASRTFEHCMEWVQLGAEITVLTCAPNFPQGKVFPGYKNRLIQKENLLGIKVIRVWTYMAPNKGFAKRIADYLSFMIAAFIAGLTIKTDIILATSPQFFTAVAGKALSIVKHKPWIMEVRDLWPDSIAGVEAIRNKAVLSFFYRMEKRLYKHASMIVPVTDTFKKEIIKKGIDPGKIHVIKNGSNTDLFKPIVRNDDLKKRLGLEDKYVISYIGTHGMAHGLDFIINCAEELYAQNIFFLFIGEGAVKKELAEMVSFKKIRNVVMLDPVPKNRIPDYLSITDISLIPLRKAGIFTTVIPSKIFESAAMEIPILLGVDGESRTIIEKYHAGLYFEPENREDFIRKIFMLKENRTVYDECKAGGRMLSVDFDRKKLAADFFRLMNDFNEHLHTPQVIVKN